MSEAPVERRLAAILAADVVGYSRLMGVDEVGTLRALRACRRELIDPAIAARHGRIVKTTGDGMLAEFASAVDAVACAISVQQGAARRNQDVPEDKRLVFRVGINLGDIIIEAGDIFGDGVNVAARLETLCEPGGVCISRAVRDQVRDKLPVAFDDFGEQAVKNIARPVRAFGLSPQAIAAAPELAPSTTGAPGRARRYWLAAAAVAMAIAIGGAGWWWIPRHSPPSAAIEAAQPTPPAPVAAARASIAVLPFTSRGGEGSGDYFADGLTEDIIAALGRFRELSVMARAAVFAYKGKNPTPAEVGRDLRVRYVVEGSVRRSPDRLRASVSLTDTSRGAVLWSDKYDSELKDIFAVQDEITRRISGALAVRVSNVELASLATKPPSNLEAHDLALRGRDLLSRLTRPANVQARALFERAIQLDPNYAAAYVGWARSGLNAVNHGWSHDPAGAVERAAELARKAIQLDPNSPGAHAVLARAVLKVGDYDRALDEAKRAIELNGSDTEAYDALGMALLYRGDFGGAIDAYELVEQFDPARPADTDFHLALAYFLAGRSPDAVRVLEQSINRNRSNMAINVMLAAAYAAAGREKEAERQAESVRRRFPAFSDYVEAVGSQLRDPAQRDKLRLALKKAGL